ncbi:MAG: bifunctional precorrin-2 dehydrogenase/sirohydrochlorin ferrochelatase [Vagococcus sp.]|uniref:precorrin-2 dehydrogenase/sirohydrochlorin ferrochelatase family protein n=1 Tax=Vagococcus sp. TaxID=1933889 RepID=UPI002FC71376
MYPITLNLKNKEVLIIGGGKIAARKVRGLLKEDAKVKIISPTLYSSISKESVEWLEKIYETGDIIGNESLIFACTDNNELNEQIRKDAHSSQMVNVVSNKKVSDFYNMSMIKYKGVNIGISTEGASPMIAKQTRVELEEWLKNK